MVTQVFRIPMGDSQSGRTTITLGVQVTIAATCTIFQITPNRVQTILALIRTITEEDELSPAFADSFAGKLSFALAQTFNRAGRPALQPIYERARERSAACKALTPAILSALQLLAALLPLIGPRIIPHAMPRALRINVAYVDARGLPSARIAIVLFTQDGEAFVAAARPPDWILAELTHEHTMEHIVDRLEALAILTLHLTCPHIMRLHPTLVHSDNIGALSAVVYGYASRTHLAQITNLTLLYAHILSHQVRYDYVPSADNISDMPTRMEMPEVLRHAVFSKRTVTVLELVFPSQTIWHEPALVITSDLV